MDASEENVQLPANPADPILQDDAKFQAPTLVEQVARPETPSSTHPTSDQVRETYRLSRVAGKYYVAECALIYIGFHSPYHSILTT
jgi:hypothetical protein